MSDQPTTSASEADDAHAILPGSSESLFVRNATGLVRGLSQRDNMLLAALGGVPALFVAYSIFFALSGFPGGDIVIGGLLVLPIMIAFAGTFGLMTAAIPRSGGDYTIVSRVLTPLVGLISSFCMVIGGMALSGAYLAHLAATFGVAPSLQTIGVVANSSTLFRWGTDVANQKAWWFGIGVLVFLIGAAAHWAGHRWVRRVLWTGFLASTGGLLVATIITLFTSPHDFADAFNATTRVATGSAHNYENIQSAAAKAGVNLHPGFSLSATIGILCIFGTAAIYTYFASFAGGELRQGGSGRTWTRMAIGGTITLAVDLVCIVIMLHSWGKPFLTAAFGGGLPRQLGAAPTYFTLTSYQVGSTAFAVVICLSFLVVFPMILVQEFLGMTRVLFAYSFDGILPEGVARVSKRTNSPTAAIGVTLVVFVVTLAWSVFVANDILQVIVYATVIQMVAQILVGISAAVFPWRRRALYKAGGVTSTIGGIPLVTIFGVSAVLSGMFLIWAYFYYPFFGLADKAKFFAWFGGTVVAAVIYYSIVRAVRARQGRKLALVYAEIPPE